MSVGFSNRKPPPPPLDTPMWTVTRNGHQITAYTRVDSTVDGVEIRYTYDGEFLYSYRYFGTSLARLKPDVDAKLAALLATGWIKAEGASVK